jgi:hypothetical protein
MALVSCKTILGYKIFIHPDPVLGDQITPSGDTVTFEENGIWVAVRPLDYHEFNAPSSQNSEWDFPNPFEGVYDEYKMPIVIYLMIENRSDLSISFNPTASFSLFLGMKPLFPIQYEDLYHDLYMSRGADTRLNLIRKMLLRSYLTLNPGESVRGLLLFKRPRARERKSVKILFRARRIYSGNDEFDFIIPFVLDMEKITEPSS